jgi:hypothetical protein
MPQLVENPNYRAYHDDALTKVKEWFLFKIQDLTFNKSCNLVCVLQTLVLDQEPNQLGDKPNKGSKFESTVVFQP